VRDRASEAARRFVALAFVLVGVLHPSASRAQTDIAVITYPANGGSAADLSQPIQWTAVAGADAYYLYGGSTPGANDLVDSSELHTTSYLASTVPAGQLVYLRLWTELGGEWSYTDSTFTSAVVTATLVYPLPGATIVDITQAWTWTTMPNTQAYYLYVGSTPGAADIVNSGELHQTSYQPVGLPPGQTLYVRLWTETNNSWRYTDETVTVLLFATLTYPVNGSTDANAAQPIQWTSISSAQAYYLFVGTSPGASNLINSGEIHQTSYPATNLPVGQTLYARLWTQVGDIWRYSDSSFSASILAAVFVAPAPGQPNVPGSVTLQWSTVAGAQCYYLYVGTTAGASDVVNSGETTQTSYTIQNLADGRLLFARIWTNLNGTWRFTDLSFTTGNLGADFMYPPSNVQATTPTSTVATITWTTNVAADSRVDYGLTTSYGQFSTDAGLVTTHSLTLSALTAGTTYHYRVTSTTASASAASSDLTFTTSPSLVVSNVQVTNLTTSTATVTWTTNMPANSRVDYGLAVGYGQAATSAALVIAHSLSLSGLTPDTTYHFAATSRDAGENVAASADLTLTTPAVIHHYEYVVTDSALYVYDTDNNFALLKTIALPTGGDNVRGAVAHAGTGKLYVSYGSTHDGGPGFLIRYDLRTDTIDWTTRYNFGIDSMDISLDGSTIYMPTGSSSSGGTWHLINAANGSVSGTITELKGLNPHNTVTSLDGRYVYLGGENQLPAPDANYLEVADTATNQIVKVIGPLNVGVRPFTVTGRNTLAYTTSSYFLGFQVSNIQTGHVLYTVSIPGVNGPHDGVAPSHGISLSPDERELYVIDEPNDMVHVFDVSSVPLTAPVPVANIHLVGQIRGTATGCTICGDKDGWIRHSKDGRFVFVGDAGDVIDTATRQTVVWLQPLANTRKFVEVDWQSGNPIFGGSRAGIGRVP